MTNTPLNPDGVLNAMDTLMAETDADERATEWAHKVTTRVLEGYFAVAQPEVRGYIIVDKKTNAIDWDGELHTSIESAIESMTGPHQSMCQTVEEEDDAANDGRTAWWRIYSIHTVTDGPAVNNA